MTISETVWETALLDTYQARIEQFGAGLFAATAWDVLLAIAERRTAAGATSEQIMHRVQTSPEALERWARVLENAGLVRYSYSDCGGSKFHLTTRARAGLANLAAVHQLFAVPDSQKIALPGTRSRVN